MADFSADYPFAPPPELVNQWLSEHFGYQLSLHESSAMVTYTDITAKAARWGADMELEACCDWLHWQNLATHADLIPSLRAARRPKPPSLKEQALEALNEAVYMADDSPPEGISTDQAEIIRRALEQLND